MPRGEEAGNGHGGRNPGEPAGGDLGPLQVRSGMCGRIALWSLPEDLAEIFGALPPRLELPDPPRPRYNLAPTEPILVVRGGGRRGRALEFVSWGIRPDGPASRLVINARSETVARRPLFRDLVRSDRGAVLADAFYEWRNESGVKRAYLVRRRDGRPMALAGLLAPASAERSARSGVILTTAANRLLRPLHGRMPVVLDGRTEEDWLTGRFDDVARTCLHPSADDRLELVPVGRRVNDVRFDDPTCAEPCGETIREPIDWGTRLSTEEQGSLF